MILTEVTRANAMCWPPFPVIREVSVEKSQHSYTSHWNHWKLFQNIPIKLAPLCPPPLLLSQLAFGGPSYLSFLNIGFQPKQKMARVAAGDSVKSSRLQRFDFGCLNSRRWETSTRWRKCLVSICQTREKHNNFGTTDFCGTISWQSDEMMLYH